MIFFQFFRDMQRLNLAKNKLKSIPHEAISGLIYLEHLELSENPISKIKPGDFQGKAIYILNSGTCLEQPWYSLWYVWQILPPSITNLYHMWSIILGLDNLDHLSINHNQLEQLGKGLFSGLPRLTTLYIDNNRIKSIHNEAFSGLEGKMILKIYMHVYDQVTNWYSMIASHVSPGGSPGGSPGYLGC